MSKAGVNLLLGKAVFLMLRIPGLPFAARMIPNFLAFVGSYVDVALVCRPAAQKGRFPCPEDSRFVFRGQDDSYFFGLCRQACVHVALGL